MKKFLMAAVALTALTATPAMAAEEQTYTFDGTVASICTISGATKVAFGALTDGNGAYNKSAATATATDSGAYCNQGLTTAAVKHTNLVNAVAASSGFTNVVPMSASLATTQGASINDTSAAGSATGTSGTIGAFTGLSVTATLGSIGTDKLVAGTYDGSITVTLTPTS